MKCVKYLTIPSSKVIFEIRLTQYQLCHGQINRNEAKVLL